MSVRSQVRLLAESYHPIRTVYFQPSLLFSGGGYPPYHCWACSGEGTKLKPVFDPEVVVECLKIPIEWNSTTQRLARDGFVRNAYTDAG